jgi:hypothetical protein
MGGEGRGYGGHGSGGERPVGCRWELGRESSVG